ncbi:MAG: hypothetical protein Q4A83_02670, partial [Bacillota bacterium]|nr:hypothetical protein [Bacillota bacterium]
DYDYDAFQYITTYYYGYYDDYGDFVEEDWSTYYTCSNCGYEGNGCPDYCDGCGAYFYDWNWEYVYYDWY